MRRIVAFSKALRRFAPSFYATTGSHSCNNTFTYLSSCLNIPVTPRPVSSIIVPMKKILFICGSLNQTTQMHKIAEHLEEYECRFSPFYGDGLIGKFSKAGYLDFTVLGGNMRRLTVEYLREHRCLIDEGGIRDDYHLVLTCSDLIVQKNIRNKKVILVQEGMTDPENLAYHAVKHLKLPRYLASTSTAGLSHAYERFCVASEGYRDLFIRKGVKADRIVVTGIPNFDHAEQYMDNDFPHKGHVLAATSDARETFKIDRRKKFIRRAAEIAEGRKLIFKLHPNENVSRSAREIRRHAPGALVYADGNAHHMVANCDVLVTQYSSLAFTGISLGKEVHSYFDVDTLRELSPIQNRGTSAGNIAGVCREMLE